MVGIGFFAPFPLALMVPFMAGQSLAMGEAFGKGFQYGKRKISSMSNEEFNKLDFRELSESLATDYRVMIPSLTKSIENSQVLQQSVFKALGQIITSIPENAKEFLQGIYADITGEQTTTSLTSASALGALGSTTTNVRLGSSRDLEKERKQTTRDLLMLQQQINKLHNEIVTQETLQDAKDRQIAKELAAKSNEISSSGTGLLETTLRNVRATAAIASGAKAPFDTSQRTTGVGAASIAAHQASLKPLTLPRAPSSVCIQIRKYAAEYHAAQTKIQFWFGRSKSNVAHWQTIRNQAATNSTNLSKRYNTTGCKQ